ncbi:MAG TPA: nucleoside hydrolase [Candidatus Alectryocaccomicrobium excrementavium]|uniref:Nucleoside hydrolase n=1 Tax=Candidatus Alectryocaccomicrobium excrementavium TaxID=2840668 RepID=A0A9D1FZF3_9FIRM|nr:nucleoside hydrolase [Candidatus Alectryocaccomicrobium excrementavium]
MKWNLLPMDELVRRLEPPRGKVKMVLDTDTYNEVDDQFALAYSLLSPEKLEVLAVYAAPYFNDRSSGPEDGMEKSYAEIVRLLEKMGRPGDGFVFKGSRSYLPNGETPVESEAARDLVKKALAMPDGELLYVVAIGAITNVASAILMEPEIVKKISVVWLGGHPLSASTAREFNLMQDVPAARVLLDCGVPFTLVPCMGVASHLLATVPDMKEAIGGKNALCDALVELFGEYSSDHFGWAKEIWDVSTIAYLVNPDWIPTVLEHSPLITDDFHWAKDAHRHFIRVATFAHRTPVFRDLYRKLAQA